MERDHTEGVVLSDAERERIFRTVIVPRFLATEGTPLPERREAVILGGQPGAGKTGFLSEATQDLRSRGATWTINGDDFYAYHPRYAELQAKFGAEAAHMVKDVAKDWVEKTLAEAMNRGVNIALESTMRQPAVVKATLEQLQAADYQVHAKVLAVNEHVSWQGNHTRYERLLQAGTFARLTSRQTHDQAVRGVLQTVDTIEREKLANRVTVYTRGGQVLYDNTHHGSRWAHAAEARKAIVDERDRPMNAADREAHWRGWERVSDSMLKRNAPVKDVMGVMTQQRTDDTALKAAARAASRSRPTQQQDTERAKPATPP
ncbi:zeta toxin family protein, partial [Xanthomonas phaseoli]